MPRVRFALCAGAIALLTASLGTATSAQETSLIFAAATPATAEVNLEFMKPWAERVNAQGKGVLRIDYREGLALANTVNSYDRVLSDAVQISFMLPAYVAGKFPRSQVVTLPFVAPENGEEGSVALWRLYADGTLAAEYDQIHPLMIAQISQGSIHLIKPLASPMELNGLKLMVTSRTLSDTISRLGGAPLSLPIDQLYESVSRRLVDGAVTGWPTFQPFKMIEITTYHIDKGLGSSVGVIFMTKAKYNALPVAARQILDTNSGEAASRAYGRFWNDMANRARELIKKTPGQRLVPLDAAQTAQWREKSAPVIADWAKSIPDGRKLLDRFTLMLAAIHAGM
jgi:TRAP-type transport system periplasmic protein